MINIKKTKFKYQNQAFIKQLKQARNYKRIAKSLPQNNWQFFLTKIGLGSFFSKTIAAVVVILIIYLIYVPNFLNVKQITIEGIALQQKQSIASTVSNFLNTKPLWPQRNIILLSKNDLADYLIKNNKDILKIENIEKKFPAALVINLVPRSNRFLLSTSQTKYIVSNDGIVSGKYSISSTTTTLSSINPINIQLNSNADFQVNQKIFSQDWLAKIIQVENELKRIMQTDFIDFELKNLNDTNLIALYTKPPNHKVFFDTSLDLQKALAQYKLLWENLKSEQKQNLYYVDLKTKDKAFVCYKNTACAKEISTIPVTIKTVSSTPEIIK